MAVPAPSEIPELPDPPRRGWLIGFLAGLLFLATVLIYGRAIRFDFVSYDDPHYITQNPRLAGGLCAENIKWAFQTFYFNNWHPLTWLTYFGISQLWGVRPEPFHLANILIHAINGVLLFLLLYRMTGRWGCAAMAAGLFSLHPLHVESVAWVSELKDVLCVMLSLLTMHAYLSYCKSRSAGSYLAVGALFALSLMAKPMAVTLPFLLLLLDYWPLQRLVPLRRSVLEKIPLLAMSIALSVVTTIAQRTAIEPTGPLTFGVRLENAIVAYGRYLAKTLVPIRLSVFYPHPAIVGDGPQLACFIVSALALLAITVGVVRHWRDRPYLLFGWLWFIGTLVPVIGLIQIGEQSMADRYTYLPLIGLFIGLVWFAADAMPRDLVVLRGAAGVGILLACSIATEIQLGYWKNSQALFTHALAVTRSNYIAMDHLATERIEQGRAAEAIPLADESMKINPASIYSYLALARAYDVLHDPEKALAAYRQAMQIDPADAEVHNNAGNALATLGRLAEAVAEYQRALDIDPQMASAECNLAYVLAAQGQIDSAIKHWQRALTIDPQNAAAKRGLTMAHAGVVR